MAVRRLLLEDIAHMLGKFLDPLLHPIHTPGVDIDGFGRRSNSRTVIWAKL